MTQIIYNSITGEDLIYNREKIADFLFVQLDNYRDSRENILKALDFVFDKNKGGLIILGIEKHEIVGAVVINHTGMQGYIPENILVYIAVHKEKRGKGIGKDLMKNAIKLTKGSIALHVEPENPAKQLYENMGFNNKNTEMPCPANIK